MNIFEAYNHCKKTLEKAGIEDYAFESRQIIRHLTGYSNAQILSKYQEKLSKFKESNLTVILRQREIRYPLQYALGEWSFFGRDYFVGPGALIPRQDTETLVDKALEFLKAHPSAAALDLGTGTGCIGITLACQNKQAKIDLLEKYEVAAEYAKKNISRNNADNAALHIGDIFEGTLSENKYDLIVSNPPYIPENEMSQTSPEVKYEPETALLAADSGLEFYKAIINNYKNSLNDNGMMAFEVGKGEAEAVAELMTEAGFTDVGTKSDYNGICRVVFGTANFVK